MSLSKHLLVRLAGVVLAATAGWPLAVAEIAAGVEWRGPSSVDLEVDFPGQGYHASWQLHRCTCGDLLIRSELNVPGEVVHGDILLVDNRAVLMRGYDPGSTEQVSFDAPALMMQLALRLLERLAPGGPPSITQREEVAVEDNVGYIHLDTGAAVGSFPPPWQAHGAIWPQGDSQRRFEIVFQFNPGTATGEQAEMKLAGLADYAATEFPLDAATPLSEWKLSWREEDDPAAAGAAGVKTLGDLRALLRQSKSGTPASS